MHYSQRMRLFYMFILSITIAIIITFWYKVSSFGFNSNIITTVTIDLKQTGINAKSEKVQYKNVSFQVYAHSKTTSSLCEQSSIPQPLWPQSDNLRSLPLQATLSNQVFPVNSMLLSPWSSKSTARLKNSKSLLKQV